MINDLRWADYERLKCKILNLFASKSPMCTEVAQLFSELGKVYNHRFMSKPSSCTANQVRNFLSSISEGTCRKYHTHCPRTAPMILATSWIVGFISLKVPKVCILGWWALFCEGFGAPNCQIFDNILIIFSWIARCMIAELGIQTECRKNMNWQ